MQLVSITPFSGPPDPFAGLAHFAAGLTRGFVLVAAGVLAGRALARAFRAADLRWTWALVGLLVPLPSYTPSGWRGLLLPASSLTAARRGRRWHRVDLPPAAIWPGPRRRGPARSRRALRLATGGAHAAVRRSNRSPDRRARPPAARPHPVRRPAAARTRSSSAPPARARRSPRPVSPPARSRTASAPSSSIRRATGSSVRPSVGRRTGPGAGSSSGRPTDRASTTRLPTAPRRRSPTRHSRASASPSRTINARLSAISVTPFAPCAKPVRRSAWRRSCANWTRSRSR